MPKKTETKISNDIRAKMLLNFGTHLHKPATGAYAETGASDLYGTLPGGRAIYVEVKTPDTILFPDKRRKYQNAWLERERALGAFTAVVCSYEYLVGLLMKEKIYPQSKT